jgi:hypothetical protein
MTIGKYLPCYATIQIPEDTPLTRESLEEIVEHVMIHEEWGEEEVIFEIETRWSSAREVRVASVRDDKGNYLVEDMAIDVSPCYAGQTLMGWLRRYGPTFEAVINSAAEARLIDEPVMETHHGTLKLPGAKAIDAEFSVRKGATREEMDLAFFEALAQIGTVDYARVAEEVNHGV